MKILVTGGAGFIGSHYVRTLLAGGYPGFEDARVTVLDKLTYAGNLANLGPVSGSPRFAFVHGDICDRALLASVVPGHDIVVNFAAETHVDRSIAGAADFVTANVAGVQVLLQACLDAKVGRVVQVSTDEVYGSVATGSWTEDDPARPELALRRGEGRRRPDRAGLRPDIRAARQHHPVLQQLRSLPVPGEGHPAVRHQPARRAEGARSTATAATSAAGSTWTTTAGASSWSPSAESPGGSTTSTATRSWPTAS